MSNKINGSQDNQPVQQANGLEGVYRTLTSSKRQKLFAKVLDQVQNSGKEVSNKENYSIDSDLSQLQHMNALDPKTVSADRTAKANPAQGREQSNTLATSTLLSLTALTSGSNGLNNGYLKAIGVTAGGGGSSIQSNSSRQSANAIDSKDIGSLSARFESGDNGIATIGYDEGGGTSYGTYQIASRPGTMKAFLEYLQDKAPKLAARLRAAGPTNTGGRNGAMPKVWKQIASEDGDGFAKLQRDFIEQTHYLPALQEIRDKTGVDVSGQSRALKEVLWSTAVQHGPKGAANIFCKAINRNAKPGQTIESKDLIDSIYSSRGKQFASSRSGTRSAVQGRFQEEKSMVLAMLDNPSSSSLA